MEARKHRAENHRQRRLGSSPRQDNSCTAKRGMQGLLNSAGKGGGGGVGGDNANDGRFEMQIASRVYSGRDPFTFLLPLSLSATNCSHRLSKVAIFAQCVEVTATSKGQQRGGGCCNCLPHCVMACFACSARACAGGGRQQRLA